MVFESLVNPSKIVSMPYWKVFLLGLFYSSVAIFLSFWIFRSYVSIVMVSLTVIASIVLIHTLIIYEEDKDEKIKSEVQLLKIHSRLITTLTFLFLGFVASFALWYVLLPGPIAQSTFNVQIETIKATTIMPSGNFVNPVSAFSKIFFNNIKILFFCIIFSFFYGAGAIFILTWNASVMGTAIGSFIRNGLSTSGASYFGVATYGLIRYLLHGIPEIGAYFVGALAGGLISVAIVKHEFDSPNFRHTAIDALDLVLVSVAILFLAAMIEIFITPLFF